jgi:hypothetical protein
MLGDRTGVSPGVAGQNRLTLSRFGESGVNWGWFEVRKENPREAHRCFRAAGGLERRMVGTG